MIVSSQEHSKRDEFLKEITYENFDKVVDKYFPKPNESGLFKRVKGKLGRILKR